MCLTCLLPPLVPIVDMNTKIEPELGRCRRRQEHPSYGTTPITGRQAHSCRRAPPYHGQRTATKQNKINQQFRSLVFTTPLTPKILALAEPAGATTTAEANCEPANTSTPTDLPVDDHHDQVPSETSCSCRPMPQKAIHQHSSPLPLSPT